KFSGDTDIWPTTRWNVPSVIPWPALSIRGPLKCKETSSLAGLVFSRAVKGGIVSTVYSPIRGKALTREELPIYLILAGVAASIVVAADLLVGNARIGNLRPGYIGFIGITLAILVGGLV